MVDSRFLQTAVWVEWWVQLTFPHCFIFHLCKISLSWKLTNFPKHSMNPQKPTIIMSRRRTFIILIQLESDDLLWKLNPNNFSTYQKERLAEGTVVINGFCICENQPCNSMMLRSRFQPKKYVTLKARLMFLAVEVSVEVKRIFSPMLFQRSFDVGQKDNYDFRGKAEKTKAGLWDIWVNGSSGSLHLHFHSFGI